MGLIDALLPEYDHEDPGRCFAALATAYTEALRRTPDPYGFQYWVSQMQQGQSPNAVISGLLGPSATR